MADIKDIEEKGVINVSYPADLRRTVEDAVEAWKKFCALPEEVRGRFPYNPGDGMGVGYELKKTPGATLDLKEDFHLTLSAREWLTETARTTETAVIEDFVGKAEDLIAAMAPLVVDFAQSLEDQYGLSGFASDTEDNKNQWFIRFLHYFGDRDEGEEIATPHVDKSAFTLHLFESDPGLQYLTHEYEWKDMPVSAGETAIIPGMRMQYRSENRIKATCHRVVATTKTAETGRFSVVCFIHPSNTAVYDKQKAGRLQEFDPGFNYEMLFEDFAKLFTR